MVVRAPWAADGVRDFGFVRFEPGDVFTEHYWRDRWYAVKEVRTGDGTLKGWYCDVTRPAVVRGLGPGEPRYEVLVEDLDLDLWASADGGTVLRLDEDEFEESGLADRDPARPTQPAARWTSWNSSYATARSRLCRAAPRRRSTRVRRVRVRVRLGQRRRA